MKLAREVDQLAQGMNRMGLQDRLPVESFYVIGQ
jgi:hypothetical protein